MPDPRYRLYIDESGDHTFKHLDRPERRYLALLGIWFDTGSPYLRFARELQALKDEIFGPRPDDPVILHREDIINKRGSFYRLRNPEVAERFDTSLLEVVHKGEFKICCVVIDKQVHEPKTYRALHHPYHYCLAALLERYVGLLDRLNATGDVLAESRGKTEDQQLKEAFVRIYNSGTTFHPAASFAKVLTSKEIKLKKKTHCIAGLELADILASPLRRQIVAEHTGEAVPVDFGNRLVQTVENKFNCHLYDGHISGYGKVCLADMIEAPVRGLNHASPSRTIHLRNPRIDLSLALLADSVNQVSLAATRKCESCRPWRGDATIVFHGSIRVILMEAPWKLRHLQ